MQEASHECIWLHSIIHHIYRTSKLSTIVNVSTVIFEDNVACIAQFSKFSKLVSFNKAIKLMLNRYALLKNLLISLKGEHNL